MSDDTNHTRRSFLTHAAVALGVGRPHMLKQLFGGAALAGREVSAGSELDSLRRATRWLNSRALTAADLRGKVVLVQFWTFTCINWLRTMPYIRAWADKYRDTGLVVIGAHTPEFPFERNLDSVRRATRDLNVSYPVAVDNEYAIWEGFKNQYWPALYLMDVEGRVRHHQFGEGAYADVERAIQQLLSEAGARSVDRRVTAVEGRGLEVAADWSNLKTPETYVGYARAENFASPRGAKPDRSRVYSLPRELRLNEWALAGDWTVRKGNIALNQAGGRIAFCFHGRDLHLVMGPPASGRSVRFRVTLDGQPPTAAHGGDVDEQGNGVAADQRLYQLVRQPMPIVDRVFQIEFLDRGVEAFSFTFG